MNDLRELYQELILEHSRSPRNFGPLTNANRDAEGHNPLCGDQVHVFATVGADGTIQDIHFEGQGCAISTAAASVMTELVKGKSEADARQLFELFHGAMTGTVDTAKLPAKLQVFAGVKDYPMRVKCATLAWHTLQAALDNTNAPISTE